MHDIQLNWRNRPIHFHS